MDDFSTWQFEVPETFSNCTGKEKGVWIVPARCFACDISELSLPFSRQGHGDSTSYATAREQRIVFANIVL